MSRTLSGKASPWSRYTWPIQTATGVPPAQPGQFLTLRLPTDKGRKSILRSYSLSGAPGASTYRVSVKREPHGVGSQFVHDRVRPGDRLDVAAPRGTFILRPSDAPVLLLSAGVGATPVLAMLHALEGTQSSRDVWWLHGARNRAEEPFATESRSLLSGTAEWPPICLLQPPQPCRCCWTRLPEGWAPHGIGPGHTRPAT